MTADDENVCSMLNALKGVISSVKTVEESLVSCEEQLQKFCDEFAELCPNNKFLNSYVQYGDVDAGKSFQYWAHHTFSICGLCVRILEDERPSLATQEAISSALQDIKECIKCSGTINPIHLYDTLSPDSWDVISKDDLLKLAVPVDHSQLSFKVMISNLARGVETYSDKPMVKVFLYLYTAYQLLIHDFGILYFAPEDDISLDKLTDINYVAAHVITEF